MKNLDCNIQVEPVERTLTTEEAAVAMDATMQLIDLIARKIAEKILSESKEV